MPRPRSRFAEAFDAQQTAAQMAARARKSAPGSTPRRFERFELREPGDLLLDRLVVPVVTLNISKDGMAVRLPCSGMPEVGDLVSIRLCDGLHLCGRPVWSQGDELGIKFSITLENVGDVIHLENRHASVYLNRLRSLNVGG